MLLLALAPGTPLGASPDAPVHIEVNGQRINTDVAPFIQDQRTFVPLRFVAEGLGLDVHWNEQRQTVRVSSTEAAIILRVGDPTLERNGSYFTMDTTPRIVADRTFVPVRFVAEHLGATVVWDGASRTVAISGHYLSAADPQDPPPDLLPGRDLPVHRIPLGVGPDTLREAWGQPERRDLGLHGIDWWVYEPEAQRVIRAGFRDQRLVAVYTLGQHWRYQDVSVKSQVQEARESLNITGTTELYWQGYRYEFICPEDGAGKERLPIVRDGNRLVTVFVDQIDNRVAAVQVFEPDAFMRTNPFRLRAACSIRASSEAPLPDPVRLSGSDLERARQDDARSMLDLVNVERAQRHLVLLTWDQRLQEVAQGHSDDMAENDFFSHTSPNTGTLGDRFRAADLGNCGGAENLAVGYEDAMASHHALMNSSGHRRAILASQYRLFGAASAQQYYTALFAVCP